jgi:hypothetical protein
MFGSCKCLHEIHIDGTSYLTKAICMGMLLVMSQIERGNMNANTAWGVVQKVNVGQNWS